MILADTSVLVGFFRGPGEAAALANLLEANEISMHPWVVGELALGGLGNRRDEVLADLARLPRMAPVSDEEVLELIHARALSGRGIGWVDAQLLAAALVAGHELWTFDRRLAAVAHAFGMAR